MKNFIQYGDLISMTAPYVVAAGTGALFSTGMFGVAQDDTASGAIGVFQTEGVFDLTALSTDTVAAADGTPIYWDNTNKRCTTTATANTKIGSAAMAKAAGATTVRVRLNGVV